MATDDADPPFGDGSHRAATVPQSDSGLTPRGQLRGWIEHLADRGRVERYVLAWVLICAAAATVGVYQVLSVSSVLLLAVFEAVVTGLLLATVIVLTVDGTDGTDTDEFTRSSGDRSSLEQWRRGRRRP